MKRPSTLMRKAVVAAILVGFVLAPVVSADSKKEARAQVEFGIQVAEKGLWKEALFRWEKAVQLDPTYAAAYNNLAIAYEHEGQFEKAKQAYDKAVELDPKNSYIRQNYEFFKEINDRTGARAAR